jgi:hypothetical protein
VPLRTIRETTTPDKLPRRAADPGSGNLLVQQRPELSLPNEYLCVNKAEKFFQRTRPQNPGASSAQKKRYGTALAMEREEGRAGQNQRICRNRK